MSWIGKLFFALASLGGASVLAGVLWTLLAQGLWGRPAGPPPHLTPEEARAWTQAHPGGEGSPHAMGWSEVRQALREGDWSEVWPVVLTGGGLVLVLICLPLGVLLGTPEWWSGLIGLAMAIFILVRLYRALQEPRR